MPAIGDSPSSAHERRIRAIGPFPIAAAGLGVLALLAPLGAAEEPLRRVGALLAVGGGLQVLHGVRRADASALKRAVSGGVLSMLMGLLVLAAPDTAAATLTIFLAVTFAIDGIGYARTASRSAGRPRQLA